MVVIKDMWISCSADAYVPLFQRENVGSLGMVPFTCLTLKLLKLIRVPCKGSNIFPYFPYECLTATIHQLNNFIRVP